MKIYAPEPGATVQAGNSPAHWTVGEIVNRPYPVANLHNNLGRTRIGVPLSELFVISPAQKEEA